MKEIANSQELKTIQLDILKFVDKFCKEKGIRYFLSGGTLLGAIRHKGFIPWDDDIDIMMLRVDYERFVEEFSDTSNCRYSVHTFKKDNNFYYTFAQISDDNTFLIEEVNYPYTKSGVNIDLFPIDYLPENEVEIKRLFAYVNKWRTLWTLKNVRISRSRNFGKNLILFISRILLFFIPNKIFIQRILNKVEFLKNIRTSKSGVVVAGYGIKEVLDSLSFDDVFMVDFEGFKFPAPKGYDAYLKSLYGDYMQLPPKEKRITHHAFKAYWK